MKKALSILLILLLALSLLPAGALAADVVLSGQNLRVNGRVVICEKYNINGSNYFKLRDLAYVLSDTGSRFSVRWDGEKKCISLVSGEEYEPNGSELDLSGGDKSATAVPGTATLLVNGAERSDLSAYNLDGNNFFKLRDLGEALGFKVDYDKATNTAIVISRAEALPAEWRTVETVYTTNRGDNTRTVSTCDENGHTLTTSYETDYYKEEYEYSYNDLGYEVMSAYTYTSNYESGAWNETRVTATEYNLWGQKEKTVEDRDGSVTEEYYSYDDQGHLLRDEIRSEYGNTLYEYTYDARGGLIKSVCSHSEGDAVTVEYLRDEEGRELRRRTRREDGTEDYANEFEYADGRLVKETYVSGDYRTVTTYTYDEKGNILRIHTDSTDWDSDTSYTYDENGNVLTYSFYNGGDLFTSVYAYDGEGRLVREEYESPDNRYVEENEYDGEGRLLTVVHTGSDYSFRKTCIYDTAAGKLTETTVVTYPAAAELVLSAEELDLAVGDEDYIGFYFLPYNAAWEAVTWSSSDEGVADVDGGGYVTAVGAGTAVVTAVSENGLTASCTVRVTAEKYSLGVSERELELHVGDVRPLRCAVEVAGTYRSYKLRFDRGGSDGIFLKWGEWDNSEIDLLVTGLEAGKYSFRVQVISTDEETVYTEITIPVTVRDDNVSEKP